MKNRKKTIIIIAILLIVILLLICFKMLKKENGDGNLLQDLVTVNELKEETGLTGDADIYEVQEDYDGRQILAVKASLKYKVAFAGMVKNSNPTMEELDTILNENSPKENGIWIEKNSRDKILEIFNNEEVNSEYIIDDEGYLKIKEKNSQNDMDKKIEKIIDGDKLYILEVSSVCYIVDDVTGEILDYNFENMDKYQTYEYFDDDGKMIIFITENSKNQLAITEIFESILGLITN